MRPRASAFTLLELLVVLGLLTMTAEIAVPIMRWLIIDVHDAETDAASAACLDGAMSAMRKDVWEARGIHIAASDHLTVTSPAGREITWQLDADGSLVRAESSTSARQWTTFLSGISFARDGSVVVFTIAGSPHHPGSTISMMSPMSLYASEAR